MSEIDHELCRYLLRDEAVRAAEDAAAVPAIQHRDLPEQVALLWACVGDLIGRVVRLEGEMDAGQDEEAAPAVCDSASPAEGLRTERVTLEITHGINSRPVELATWVRSAVSWKLHTGESVRVVDEADAASDEAVAHGATLSALADARESLAAANRGIARLTAERDAAIRERDAARVRVAEPEAAAPPLGWLTAEERAAVEEAMVDYASNVGDNECERIERVLRALLARETPPSVKVPSRHVIITTVDARERIDRQWIAAIRAAGGEVEG